MKGSTTTRRLSLVATAVALALGSTATFAQERAEEQAENVDSAERRLERAEDRVERAEQQVEQRRDELEEARQADVGEADADRDFDRDSERRAGNEGDWNDLMAEHESLSSFMEALEATGLHDTLTGDTAYTVFAPTNDAFDDKWNDLRDAENRQELIELLRAHIVADDVDAERARTLGQALTVDGGIVDISEEDGELMVGDAKVVDADINRGSLRIHAIDGLLDVNPAEQTAALRDSDRDDDRGGLFNRDRDDDDRGGLFDRNDDRDRDVDVDIDRDRDRGIDIDVDREESGVDVDVDRE